MRHDQIIEVGHTPPLGVVRVHADVSAEAQSLGVYLGVLLRALPAINALQRGGGFVIVQLRLRPLVQLAHDHLFFYVLLLFLFVVVLFLFLTLFSSFIVLFTFSLPEGPPRRPNFLLLFYENRVGGRRGGGRSYPAEWWRRR